jgi:hypothetical protein
VRRWLTLRSEPGKHVGSFEGHALYDRVSDILQSSCIVIITIIIIIIIIIIMPPSPPV